MVLQDFLPVLEEIFVEHHIFRVRSLEHSSIEASYLLGLGRKINRFTCEPSGPRKETLWTRGHTVVLHFDMGGKRFIRRRENYTIVL